jgi:hypothetical protein
MTRIVAGAVPHELNVPLPRNGTFLWQVTNPTGDWAGGESLELRFYAVDPASADNPTNTAWPATITGAVAAWAVAPDDVQAVLDAGLNYAALYYIDTAGEPIIWAKGRTNAY